MIPGQASAVTFFAGAGVTWRASARSPSAGAARRASVGRGHVQERSRAAASCDGVGDLEVVGDDVLGRHRDGEHRPVAVVEVAAQRRVGDASPTARRRRRLVVGGVEDLDVDQAGHQGEHRHGEHEADEPRTRLARLPARAVGTDRARDGGRRRGRGRRVGRDRTPRGGGVTRRRRERPGRWRGAGSACRVPVGLTARDGAVRAVLGVVASAGTVVGGGLRPTSGVRRGGRPGAGSPARADQVQLLRLGDDPGRVLSAGHGEQAGGGRPARRPAALGRR